MAWGIGVGAGVAAHRHRAHRDRPPRAGGVRERRVARPDRESGVDGNRDVVDHRAFPQWVQCLSVAKAT